MFPLISSKAVHLLHILSRRSFTPLALRHCAPNRSFCLILPQRGEEKDLAGLNLLSHVCPFVWVHCAVKRKDLTNACFAMKSRIYGFVETVLIFL